MSDDTSADPAEEVNDDDNDEAITLEVHDSYLGAD